MARGDPHEHLLPAASDQDRGAPNGLGLVDRVLQPEVASFEAEALLAPQALQDLRSFLERLHALCQRRERVAVALELGLEPARAEADDGAAVRDVIDGRDLLREDGGIAEEGRRDQRSEADTLGLGAHGGELAPRLEDRQGRHGDAVDVIACPDRVVAQAIELPGRLARLLPAALDLRQRHPELAALRHSSGLVFFCASRNAGRSPPPCTSRLAPLT